jgi:death on curing protein
VNFLSSEQVLLIHSRLIDITGGVHGIRDLGLLQSAVSRPMMTFGGEYLYPDIFHKAAALMGSLIKNYPFLDGNKRTAITSAALFIERNGYILQTTQTEIEVFTIGMAASKCSFDDAVEWFKKHALRQRK